MATQSFVRFCLRVCALCSLTAPAFATPVDPTYRFSWTGASGYSLAGSFSFDAAAQGSVIQVGNPAFTFPVPREGAGPVSPLTSLTVSFFDPDSTPLLSYDTVANGISDSVFFAFQFDTVTEEVVLDSYFNIGGGEIIAGVQFFTGTNGQSLSLFQHTVSTGDGSPIVLDSTSVPGVPMGDSIVTVERMTTAVHEPETFALLALPLMLLATRRRTRPYASLRLLTPRERHDAPHADLTQRSATHGSVCA
ncbi:MAG: hypothetical protein AAF648_05840 [Pseudomonadota bacterium]